MDLKEKKIVQKSVEMEDQQLKDLITHVFLPRRIEIVEKDAEIPHINFIELFIKSLRVLSKEFPQTISFLEDSKSIYEETYFRQKTLKDAFQKKKSLIFIYSTKHFIYYKAKDKDIKLHYIHHLLDRT